MVCRFPGILLALYCLFVLYEESQSSRIPQFCRKVSDSKKTMENTDQARDSPPLPPIRCFSVLPAVAASTSCVGTLTGDPNYSAFIIGICGSNANI